MDDVAAKHSDEFAKHSHRFMLVGIFVVLAYILGVQSWARQRKVQATSGILVLGPSSAHGALQKAIPFLVLAILLIPEVVFVICKCFGLLLALAEGWPHQTGFEFLIGNCASVSNPITSAMPKTALGTAVAILVNLWCFVLITAFMGMLSLVSMVAALNHYIPQGIAGYFRFLLLHLPMLLFVSTASAGVVIALGEGWHFVDGFLFMMGSLLQAAHPFTAVSPQTGYGVFVEVFCNSVQIAIGGIILGVSTSHPFTGRLILWCEGCEEDHTVPGGGGEGGTSSCPREQGLTPHDGPTVVGGALEEDPAPRV